MSAHNHNLSVYSAKRNLMAGCAVSALLALPAAVCVGVVLASPAAAQTVIGSDHSATVNLANYGAGPVLIHGNTTIATQFGNGVIASSGAFWSLTNAGEISAASGTGILLNMAGNVANQELITGVDGIELNAGGVVSNAAGASISATSYGVLVNGAAGSLANAGKISAGYDGVSLNRGGEVANISGGTITGAHIGVYTGHGFGSVANSGVISAATGDAVSLYTGGAFTNAATGEVIGGYTGVFAGGPGSSIQNAGIITGPDFGVYAMGASRISNTGTIAGGVDGIIDTGSGGSITNSGMITGAKIGLRTVNAADVLNSGTITGGLIGMKLGAGSSLTNAAGGLIEGGSIGLQAGNDVVVNNAGTVLDKTVAGMVLSRGDVLTNTGTIGGVVGLLVNGGGANIYNAGLIASTSADGDAIQLEGGADNLTFASGSVITGAIDGGGWANQITLAGAGVMSGDLKNFGAGSALNEMQGADWTASGNWNVAQVTNAGTFQPGIIGTPLDLTGNFTQDESGTMRVLVSPTGTTHFNVTGAVELAGQLDYVLAPGAYAPATESFLTASGGVTGSFASTSPVTPPPAAMTPVVIPTIAQTQPQIQAQVQQVVQQQTSVVVPQQTQQVVFSQTPVAATPLVVATVVDNTLNVAVTRNFVVAPVDDTLFASANQAMALDAQRAGDALLAHASGSAAPCVSGTLPGSANIATALASGFCQAGGWIEATGTHFNQANAYGASNTGFLAGIDRQIAGGKLGLAVGYDETSLTDKSAGTGSVDTMRIGLYGAVPLGQVMLTGSVVDGLATEKTTRQTGAGVAGARDAGNVLGGAMQVAMPISLGGVSLLPAAGVRFADVSMGGFNEMTADPAFAVNGAASGGFTAQPYMRMTVQKNFVTASQVVFTPAASLGVTYQTSQLGAVHLTSQGGTGFAARNAALDGTAGEMSAGITASRGDWSLSAKYSAQMAGNWSSQSVQAALEVKF